MFEECTAELQMIRVFLDEGQADKDTHLCKVIRYDSQKECIYLLTGKSELPSFSLDGIYECAITSGESVYKCKGTIRERYWCRAGKVIVFRVQNGFYKNLVN